MSDTEQFWEKIKVVPLPTYMVPNVDKLSAIFTKGQAKIESEKYSPTV